MGVTFQCYAFEIYINSILPWKELDPEEEFLRNYRVSRDKTEVELFIEFRAKNEMQIYGDIPVKVWCCFIMEMSVEFKHTPLGMQVMADFVNRFDSPFHQGNRDLSNLEDFRVAYTTPLLFEMCCMECILEFNIKMRMCEENITALEFGDIKVDPIGLLREFFILCLPHPKKINNMLRAPYSWFVKMWGVGADPIVVLYSAAGDDRNSKDVFYDKFRTEHNRYKNLFRSAFYNESRRMNEEKVQEAIKYSQKLGSHERGLPIFEKMLKSVYTTPFHPHKSTNIILASFLLSIQTITGYGRAWVKNTSTDFEKQLKPQSSNLVQDVSDLTREYFKQAYNEARERREEIVKPEDLYTSMLRLARNTSSGFSTEIHVKKRFGPRLRERELIKITSRIKALVIFTKGHVVFTDEELRKKYNSVELYQTRIKRCTN